MSYHRYPPSGPKQRIFEAKQISTQTPKDTLPINTARVQLSLSLLGGFFFFFYRPGPSHETTTQKNEPRTPTNLLLLWQNSLQNKTTNDNRKRVERLSFFGVPKSIMHHHRQPRLPLVRGTWSLVWLVHSLTNVRI